MVVNSSKFNFKEIVDGLIRGEYYPDVVRASEKVIKNVAKQAAEKLRTQQETPRGKTGKYAKGWTYKVDKAKINVGATVYGKKGTYQLAHLLEYGHATRNGTGRVWNTKDKSKRPHIADVEKWAIDKAYNDMMDELRTVG